MAKRARVGERTMIIVIASFFPPVVVAKVGGGERECEVGASQEKKEARRRGRKGGSDRGAIIPSPHSLLLLLLFLSLSFLHYFFSPPSFPPPQTGGKRKGGLRLLFPLPFLICLSPFLLQPFFPTIMITEPPFLLLLSAALRPFVEGRGGKKREKRKCRKWDCVLKGYKKRSRRGWAGEEGKTRTRMGSRDESVFPPPQTDLAFFFWHEERFDMRLVFCMFACLHCCVDQTPAGSP